MTRSLCQCLLPAYQGELGWESDTQLSGAACEELKFWIDNIRSINGFPLSPKFPSLTSCKITAGDASGTGYYSAEFSNSSETLVTRKFTDEEISGSSTFRECLVVWDTFFASDSRFKFSNSTVVHYTDNQGVVSIFTKGSMKEKL